MTRQLIGLFVLLIWSLSIIYIGFVPAQSDFLHIIIPYTVAFTSYLVMWRSGDMVTVKTAMIAGIFVRFILLFSFPQLSDDVYRFLWDGYTAHAGFNPYAWLPADLVGADARLSPELFAQLNSPNYYSIYPPIAQLTFILATLIPAGPMAVEVMIMKGFLLISEGALIWALVKLLKETGHDMKRALLYVCNPLVIVEVMGNLHYESMMLAFFMLGLLALHRARTNGGALLTALSGASKLLSGMFIPAILCWVSKSKRWRFLIVGGLAGLLLFMPLFLEISHSAHFGDSLNLYMRKFEFNASIYYLLRWVGFQIKGYNMIHVLGPALALTALSGILFISYKTVVRNDLKRPLLACLLSYTVFLFLSMTIHPWYVIGALVFCIFTPFRYPVIWSYLICWTYINYAGAEYAENLWVVGMEYLVVFGVMGWEIKRVRQLSIQNSVPPLRSG